MAVYEDTTTPHNAETDEKFRTWIKAIHKALEEVGLVQTADTGQINTATVTSPAINTFAGYSIWRFNDAEHEARPVYIKFEFGKGAVAARTALSWCVGRGSNGSGTLTTPGNSGGAQTIAQPAAEPSATGYIHACFSKGAFHLALVFATGNGELGMIFVQVERLSNLLGEPQNWIGWNEGTNFPKFCLQRTPFFWNGTSWTAAGPSRDDPATESVGGLVIPARNRPAGLPALPFLSMMAFRQSQVSQGDTGVVRMNGVDYTYKRLAISQILSQELFGQGAGTTLNHDPIFLHQ